MTKALEDTFRGVKHVLDDFYGSDQPRSYAHALDSILRIVTQCQPDIICPSCGADYAVAMSQEDEPLTTLLAKARLVAESWRADGGGVDGGALVDLVYAIEAFDASRR